MSKFDELKDKLEDVKDLLVDKAEDLKDIAGDKANDLENESHELKGRLDEKFKK